MPSLLRRKSTMRRWCLWPPPWWRMVTRPWLLRPLPLDCCTVSGQCGSPLCSSGVTTLTSARRPGEVGLTFTRGISLLRGREVDFLAFGKAHVGLLPAAAPARKAAEAALLALHVGDRHAGYLGLEHELDRGLDLGLGRRVGDAEHVLPVLVGDEGALLGHHRGEHHRHQLLGTVFLGGGHFSISSSFAIAALVSRTWEIGRASCRERV